jgi:hypothetical protein
MGQLVTVSSAQEEEFLLELPVAFHAYGQLCKTAKFKALLMENVRLVMKGFSSRESLVFLATSINAVNVSSKESIQPCHSQPVLPVRQGTPW